MENVGDGILDVPAAKGDNCAFIEEIPQICHSEGADRGNLLGLRAMTNRLPGDCQKVNAPKGRRGHPGVRPYGLAMTAVVDGRVR